MAHEYKQWIAATPHVHALEVLPRNRELLAGSASAAGLGELAPWADEASVRARARAAVRWERRA